jgi:KaiC/GvpD/RAD55 family RecA-like ATPase
MLLIVGGFLVCDRVKLTAAQCHTVLRRIIRQWDTGHYTFDHGATRKEIRQESRFLDYLVRRSRGKRRFGHLFYAHKPRGPIRRKRGGYWFISKAKIEEALNGIFAGMLDGDLQSSTNCASDLWEAGRKRRYRWKMIGVRAKAPEAEEEKKAAEEDGAAQAPEAEEDKNKKKEEGYAKQFFGNKLDLLFNGGQGFRVRPPKRQEGAERPGEAGWPVFHLMVIKGQPGAGKSTQALQLCVTLAKLGYYCLYYSLEEERESLLQTARNFGWAEEDSDHGYKGVQHLDFQRRKDPPIEPGVWVSALGDRAMPVKDRKRQLHAEWQRLSQVPRCVVIDSLEGFANVGLDRDDATGVPRADLVALKDFFRDRCQLLVIVVEDDASGKPTYVDFVADTVIRLGRDKDDDYTLLVAEILKARNQGHALGQHQIKIRSRDDIDRATGPVKEGLQHLDPGIIVFPSLHYRLFEAQHKLTSADHVLSMGLDGLDQMLPGIGPRLGARRQSSLAVLGPGGSGKSVIALNFLVQGVRENTPTMLVLMHNDAAMVTSRTIPQEPHHMHFSWQPETNRLTGKPEVYHRLDWTLDGIAHWWSHHATLVLPGDGAWVDPPMTEEAIKRVLPVLSRLPYLFRLEPLSHPILPEDLKDLMDPAQRAADLELGQRWQTIDQALAGWAFLHALADCCPPVGPDDTRRWDAPARRQLRDTFNAAWRTFEDRVKAEALTLANDPSGAPKRIQLMNVDDDADETSPAPYLTWDSRSWDPHLPGTGGQGGTTYDTSLLAISEYRPGNIAPEDFLDRLLHKIGDPKRESRFERIVFDDVSQLSQRFPLLAASKLFLPTVIDMFKATGITALFLADTEIGEQAVPDSGLAVMADQVIRMSFRYLGENGELESTGPYSERQVITEVDALPGDKRHAPHILKFRLTPDRFKLGEEEAIVTFEELPVAQNGGDESASHSS